MDEWECMLSDIFDCVLRHLDTEDVKHSRLVCTTWREEVDSLISTMTLKGPLHVPNMVSRFQGLTEVILSFATEEEFTSDLWHPLRGLKRLQSLTLDNRGPVQPTILGLEELHDTSITTLRMKGCLICIACGIDYLTQLTIVELHHCILMLGRGHGLPSMLTGMRRLSMLVCEGCSSLGALPLTESPLAGLSALTTLKVCHLNRMTSVSDETCRELALLPKIEELELACGHKTGCAERKCITPAGVAALCQMTHLTHLDLSRHETISDASIQLIAQSLPRLSHLDIRAHASPHPSQQPLCTDEGISALQKLQHLQSLSVSNAHVQRERCAGIASLPDLQRLEISQCQSLNDITACELIRLSALKESCLSNSSRVTDIALHTTDELGSVLQVQRAGCAAIASLPKLQRLEISHCQSLTDTAACELMRLTALKELCLSNSSRVTDIALSTLVKAMPQLTLLDLSGCHLHVSDISLCAIANLGKLKTLILRDCERITDMGMRALCKGPAASSLVHLNVNGCERLTDAAALRMAACLHHLNTLSLEHCRHMTCRGIGALQALVSLKMLRAGGLRDSALAAAHGLRPKVTVNALENKRIWWMPAVQTGLAVA